MYISCIYIYIYTLYDICTLAYTYHIMLYAYILRMNYNILPAWIIASFVGPPESTPPPQSTIFHQDQFPEKKKQFWEVSPTKPPLSPWAIIHHLGWHQQIASVCTMVFTTCHISQINDNIPRNKHSSFYLPHQNVGPQLWRLFYLCFLVRHIPI